MDSETIGRLVLYSEVLASCMDVLHGGIFQHGLAVVAREQTRGKGEWLTTNFFTKSEVICSIYSYEMLS